MSVGFQSTSSPWKRRLWAKPSVAALVKQVRRIYSEHLADPLLVERLEVNDDGPLVLARWHPAEEGLRLTLLEDGRIQAEANTGTVGPGYHIFLISLLDKIASELKVEWTWDGDEDHGIDETGYAQARDLELPRRAMLEWLQQLCSVTVGRSESGQESFGLCWPMDSPRPEHDAHAYSPMGFWSRERFLSASQGEPALSALGSVFFPWWSLERDASFWRGLGRVIAWCDLSWVTPRDESEQRQGDFALRCFERARTMDPTYQPEHEVGELRGLLDGTIQVDWPRAEGIGHRRRPCTFPLLGAWTAVLPGHFVSKSLENGKNLQLEDGQRAVFVSAFKVGGGDGDAPLTAQEVLASGDDGKPADIAWSDGHLLTEARWENDGTSRHLMAKCAVAGRMLLLTITDDASAPQEWSEGVARSVRHPAP